MNSQPPALSEWTPVDQICMMVLAQIAKTELPIVSIQVRSDVWGELSRAPEVSPIIRLISDGKALPRGELAGIPIFVVEKMSGHVALNQ